MQVNLMPNHLSNDFTDYSGPTFSVSCSVTTNRVSQTLTQDILLLLRCAYTVCQEAQAEVRGHLLGVSSHSHYPLGFERVSCYLLPCATVCKPDGPQVPGVLSPTLQQSDSDCTCMPLHLDYYMGSVVEFRLSSL